MKFNSLNSSTISIFTGFLLLVPSLISNQRGETENYNLIEGRKIIGDNADLFPHYKVKFSYINTETRIILFCNFVSLYWLSQRNTAKTK